MISLNLFYCYEKVYPYEFMDDWEKFNETSLHEREDFYSHLNIENITDTEYTHKKRVFKDFERTTKQEPWFLCSQGYIIAS